MTKTKFASANIAHDYTDYAYLYQAVTEYDLYFPCWQRNFLWKEENFVQFFKTVFSHGHLGTMYLYHKEDGALGNADGQQRCCALATLICAYNYYAYRIGFPLIELPYYRFASTEMQRMYDQMTTQGTTEGAFRTGYTVFCSMILEHCENKQFMKMLHDAIHLVTIHIDVLKDEGAGYEQFLACNSYCQKMTSEDIIKSNIERQMNIFGKYERYQTTLSNICRLEQQDKEKAKVLFNIVKMYYCWMEIKKMSESESFFRTGAGYNCVQRMFADMNGIMSFLNFMDAVYEARQTSAYIIAKTTRRTQLQQVAQFMYMKGHNPDTDKFWKNHVFAPAFSLSISTQVKGQLANGHIQDNLDNIVINVLADKNASEIEREIYDAIDREPEVYSLTKDILENSDNLGVIRAAMLMQHYAAGNSVKNVSFVTYMPSKPGKEWTDKCADCAQYVKMAGNIFMVTGNHRLPANDITKRCDVLDAIAMESVGKVFYKNPSAAITQRTKRVVNKLMEINGMTRLMTSRIAA